MANDKDERLLMLRHSFAHVMAQAVGELFENVQFGIGPAIENGFYYDFDLDKKLTLEDLDAISAKMQDIIKNGFEFEKEVLSREKALELFKNQKYKLELINDLPENEEISIYKQGSFFDLCRGPHVEASRKLNPQSFKLMKIAGAYWRGNEKQSMLQRIYGTAWTNPKDLAIYLNQLAEAEKRDHRKIGKELDLFHIDDENPGQIFWHPHGWTIYRTLENYVRDKIKKDGYVEVKTPFVMPQSLWERSGHWAKYQENMFITESEKRIFALKPMNCPGHIEIFKQGQKSYKDLPLRIAEFGSCTRNEASGALHGIMRVRGFVQDDAHIFCTEEQIGSEVARFTALLKDMYKDFGFTEDKIIVKFSTRPELRVGSDETWDRAEKALADACEKANLSYEIAEGEGAFYGPKLEFTLVDALKRQWQCGTIQVDYQLPSKERLNAEYMGEDNFKHNPVMLHRAVLGSIERFIGILIEHFAGAFPVWLSPIQLDVIPVASTFNDYAKEVFDKLKSAGFRVTFNDSDDRLNAKIRLSQNKKIPYMLIIGEKEAVEKKVSVRYRSGKQINGIDFESFIAEVRKSIEDKI